LPALPPTATNNNLI
jgi:hypothetical protein